ncbi:MAG: hypothetical protein ACTSRG_19800 [Candidatus Helarchaeota archaeon]
MPKEDPIISVIIPTYNRAKLFIESSYKQSQEIVRIAGKPVLCVETNQIINPNQLAEICNHSKEIVTEIKNNPFKAFFKLIRSLKVKIWIIQQKLIIKIKKFNKKV